MKNPLHRNDAIHAPVGSAPETTRLRAGERSRFVSVRILAVLGIIAIIAVLAANR